jgi:hypoxanthine phosphoribosyltransferase
MNTVVNLDLVTVPNIMLRGEDLFVVDEFDLSFESMDTLIRYVWDNPYFVTGYRDVEPIAVYQSNRDYVLLEYRWKECDHDEDCQDEDTCAETRKVHEEYIKFKTERIVRAY